jgi:threonine synthase
MAMRRANEQSAMTLDPHTAIGYAAALAADLPAEVPVVTLATAHPAKFRDAVERATGGRPSLPLRVGDLFDREERYDILPDDLATVQSYIAERATAA